MNSRVSAEMESSLRDELGRVEAVVQSATGGTPIETKTVQVDHPQREDLIFPNPIQGLEYLRRDVRVKGEDIEQLQEVIEKIQREIEEEQKKNAEREKQGIESTIGIAEQIHEKMNEYYKDTTKAEQDCIFQSFKPLVDYVQNIIQEESAKGIEKEADKMMLPEDERRKRDLANEVLEKISQVCFPMEAQMIKQDTELQNLSSTVREMTGQIDLMVRNVREIDLLKKEVKDMTGMVATVMNTSFAKLISMLPPEDKVKAVLQNISSVPPQASAATAAAPRVEAARAVPVPRPRGIDLEKALHDAVLHFRLSDVRHLLNKGARVNSVRNGRTVLHMAAQMGSVELINMLLEGGANVRWADEQGRTSLHVASGAGRAAAAALLIRRGALVDVRDSRLATPLHWAVRGATLPDCVRVLITHGADPHAIDVTGQTPLQLARAEETRRVLRCMGKCPHTATRP